MTRKAGISVESCTIQREIDGVPVEFGMVDVLDENKKVFASFPEGMNDAQIRHCLRIANRLFAEGVEQGKRLKQQEIQNVLGLPAQII